MNLIFVTNARFSRTENGNIYGYHTAINHKTFEHYLKIFENVKIIARVEDVKNKVFDESIRVNLEHVDVLEVPYFIGPAQYLAKSLKVKKAIRDYLKSDDAIICRIPGTLGRIAANEAKKMKKPYGVEVASDPYDVFAPGSFNHPLRRFLRYKISSQLRNNIKNAAAAIYVTAHQLQKRYPVSNGVFETYASNVILHAEAFADSSKKWAKKDSYTIASLGSLDQMYKAPDILVRAIHKINNSGKLHVKLVWMGEGKYKNSMIELAQSLSIGEDANFVGMVKPSEKVREYLDNIDLFVLASRTEGLPRAMVEAMARGLPCVGTNVGGIPELVSEDCLVPINDADALAAKITTVLGNEVLANQLAVDNLETAKDYAYSKLNQRRFSFYNKVKELTSEFNNKK
jgi:glycosyltransferase involved in cell wall biosynthesis